MDDRNVWRYGFTPSRNWNGRLAMIGFLAAALIELFSGQGFLHFWGILVLKHVNVRLQAD